jgi:REP element-mobilizing transposase RayT
MNTKSDFQFDGYYHIYNRTNNKEALFRSDENRDYFLRQYKKYLGPYIDVFAYALMSNHFHFSIRVKDEEMISSYIKGLNYDELTVSLKKYKDRIASSSSSDRIALSDAITVNTVSDVIIDQHRRFFISYTQAINKRYDRQGNLFADRFKRSLYNPAVKFRYLQYYIHHNARKHGIVKDFKDYPYHSYKEIVENTSELINRPQALQWYDGIDDFIAFHESTQYRSVFRDLDIDGFI